MWDLNQKRPKSNKKIIKWLLIVFLIYTVLFPEDVAHGLYVVIHAVLESIASVIEEFLMHVFGLNKFYSQLIVAYSSFGLVVYFLFRLWKAWPRLAKKLTDYVYARTQILKKQLQKHWLKSTALQKVIALVLVFISFKLIILLSM